MGKCRAVYFTNGFHRHHLGVLKLRRHYYCYCFRKVISVKGLGITTAKIAADAVTAAKIADNAISEEHLDVTAITGHGNLGANLASGDSLLVHDTSANTNAGGLVEATIGNLQSYMQSNLTFTTNTDEDVSEDQPFGTPCRS